MNSSKITPIKKRLSVKFSNQEVKLPQEVQEKVDMYWNELISSGKTYKRGEVFTVTQKNVTNNTINLLVDKTDYAHFLYSQNVGGLGKDSVHIIHAAALVETSDGYIIFGEMGHQTARAGIYQLCGGGIDNDDLKGEYFDFEHNIAKELSEELDIDVADKTRIAEFSEAYFKEDGQSGKMTVVYRVVLNETKNTFLDMYDQFTQQLKLRGELPEFEKLLSLKKNKNEIQKFLAQDGTVLDECIQPLFNYIVKETVIRRRRQTYKG